MSHRQDPLDRRKFSRNAGERFDPRPGARTAAAGGIGDVLTSTFGAS